MSPSSIGIGTRTLQGSVRLLNIYKACYNKIKEVDPGSLISFDSVQMKTIFNYVSANQIPFDFYDFHNYGGDDIHASTDYCLLRAGDTYVDDFGSTYPLDVVRQMNNNNTMLSFCSEANFNSAWIDGTDIRNTHTEGVCYAALQTIYAMEIGLNYRIHYAMSSSKYASSQQPSGGWGFGILNTNNDSPFLPYYFYRLIGQNLSIGDKIVETISSNTDIKAVSWINKGSTKTLIVNKSSIKLNISINYSGEYTKIDGTSYGTQTGTFIDSVVMEPYSTTLVSESITHGYTLSIQTPDGYGTTDPITANYTYPKIVNTNVTAKPSKGWLFEHWILNGVNAGNRNPFTFTMDKNQTLKAVFKLENSTPTPKYILRVLNPEGSGNSLPIPGNYTYQQIESVSLSATPSALWQFDHWIIDENISITLNPYQVTMNANHTVKAVFKQPATEKPSGGIPGYPIEVIFIGLVLSLVYIISTQRSKQSSPKDSGVNT